MENEKMLIVLVDDNPSNLRAGKNVLAEHYLVATVRTFGKKNVQSVGKQHACTDSFRCGHAGDEQLRDDQNSQRKSGNKKYSSDFPYRKKNDTENELEGLNLGAIGYIVKPFMPSLLLKHIEVHLLVERDAKENNGSPVLHLHNSMMSAKSLLATAYSPRPVQRLNLLDSRLIFFL
jgi:response regulator RpfG family c-di-GMP phosphodiesterase